MTSPSSPAAAGTVPADIAKLSFEEALAELETIVRELETGNSDLDQAIGAYQRGAALKQHCENKLREAQAKVDKITFDADGGATATPADIG